MENLQLISIDMGVGHAGIAVFKNGDLIKCGLIRVTKGEERIREMAGSILNFSEAFEGDWVGAVEVMQYFQGRESAVDDLIQISMNIGGLLALSPRVKWRQYTARQWKGSASKAVTQERTNIILSKEEKKILNRGLYGVPKGDVDDVYDAVSIGLHFLNRKPIIKPNLGV